MTTEERDPSAPEQPDQAPDQPGEERRVYLPNLIANEFGLSRLEAQQTVERRGGITIDGEVYEGDGSVLHSDIAGKEIEVSVPPRKFVFRAQED